MDDPGSSDKDNGSGKEEDNSSPKANAQDSDGCAELEGTSSNTNAAIITTINGDSASSLSSDLVDSQSGSGSGSGSGTGSLIESDILPVDLSSHFQKPGRLDDDEIMKLDDDSGKSGESDRNEESADEGISDAASNSSSGSDNHKKKKSNRCMVCKKKVGLTGFMCRCGCGPFCSIHRYSDKHNCSFNYREQGALEIAKNNPIIQAAKITKI